MSFEGYYRILCKNGHLHIADLYHLDFNDWKCPDCGAQVAVEQLIDETNGCDYEYCDLLKDEKDICKDYGCGYAEFEVATEAIYETCNLGHKHLIKPPTYKVPKKE